MKLLIILTTCLNILHADIKLNIKSDNQLETKNNNKLKILSWNIKMLPNPYGYILKSKERTKLIISKLKSEKKYDLILFQEAFTSDSREQIYKELNSIYPYQIIPKNNDYFSNNSGLWVISAVPLELVNEIFFQESAGWDRFANKGAKLYQINKNNQDFYIINTHMQANEKNDYSYIRTSQINQINELIVGPYSKNLIPIFLIGDLNVSKSSNLIKYLNILNMKNGELNGDLNFSCYNNNTKSKELLDYILFKSNSFNYSTFSRKILKFSDLLNENQTHMSDHYPIEGIIEW